MFGWLVMLHVQFACSWKYNDRNSKTKSLRLHVENLLTDANTKTHEALCLVPLPVHCDPNQFRSAAGQLGLLITNDVKEIYHAFQHVKMIICARYRLDVCTVT
jgi:hypothetical protein